MGNRPSRVAIAGTSNDPPAGIAGRGGGEVSPVTIPVIGRNSWLAAAVSRGLVLINSTYSPALRYSTATPRLCKEGGREGGSRSWYKAVLLRRFYEYAFSGANCAPPPPPPPSCAPEGGAVDSGNRGWKARTLYRWTIIHRPRFVVETRETFPLVPGSFGTLSRQSFDGNLRRACWNRLFPRLRIFTSFLLKRKDEWEV